MENNDIYVNRIHPNDAKVIEQLTQTKSWDYAQFRKVMIALGTVGGGQSVPGRNRPDTVHLQGWRQHIDDLLARTKANGREHARVFLVDKDRKSLVVSGKTTVGTESQTRLDTSREPGREQFQRPIASIHTHPVENGTMTAHGLSGQDYRTFLGDQDQQVMIIAYGESNLMMVLKTSVTPNNLSREAVDRRIRDCEQDYLSTGNKHPIQKVVDFNKAVCAEMGLTMYTADQRSRDLFTRVNVTQ